MAHHRGQTTSAGMAERGEGRVASVPSRTLRQANGAALHIKLFILLLALLFPLGKSSLSLVSYLERECRGCLDPLQRARVQLRCRTGAGQVAEAQQESTDISAPETRYLWEHF